jgi:tRNA (mo5U34)-methyltransferase
MEAYNPAVMGNWHHDIVINAAVRTRDLSPAYNDRSTTSKEGLAKEIKDIYGEALKDKNVLDIACNAGGHLYALNRFGINSGFGFDARAIWIQQAHWVKRNIDIPCDNLTFVEGSFDVLQDFEDRHFHLSLFNGIFYHLADPVAQLAKVAEKTSELLVINTAYAPQHSAGPPALIFKMEDASIETGLSGMDGLSWLPSGEYVLYRILKHMGFPYAKLMFKSPKTNRLAVIAAREEGLLTIADV